MHVPRPHTPICASCVCATCEAGTEVDKTATYIVQRAYGSTERRRRGQCDQRGPQQNDARVDQRHRCCSSPRTRLDSGRSSLQPSCGRRARVRKTPGLRGAEASDVNLHVGTQHKAAPYAQYQFGAFGRSTAPSDITGQGVATPNSVMPLRASTALLANRFVRLRCDRAARAPRWPPRDAATQARTRTGTNPANAALL